jgi:anti-sigma factor (TIGR02949 family)
MIMDCRQCIDKIFAYLEGEMNKTDRKGFEEHIASCPSCGKELEKEKKIIAGLSSIKENVPEDFLQGVRAKIEAESPGKGKFFSLSYLLRVFVPVAAVLIIALIITRNQPTTREESEDAPGGIAFKGEAPSEKYFNAYEGEPPGEIMEEKELLQAGEREAGGDISFEMMDNESRSMAKTKKPAAKPAKSEELLLFEDHFEGKSVAGDAPVVKKDPATQILLLSYNPKADIVQIEEIAKKQQAAVDRKSSTDERGTGELAGHDDITININVSYNNYNDLISQLKQLKRDQNTKLNGRKSGLPLAMKSAAGPDDLQQKQNIIINIYQIDNNQRVIEENATRNKPSQTP